MVEAAEACLAKHAGAIVLFEGEVAFQAKDEPAAHSAEWRGTEKVVEVTQER